MGRETLNQLPWLTIKRSECSIEPKVVLDVMPEPYANAYPSPNSLRLSRSQGIHTVSQDRRRDSGGRAGETGGGAARAVARESPHSHSYSRVPSYEVA